MAQPWWEQRLEIDWGATANLFGWLAAGEFSVDLFTLPDNLGKMIWDYLVSLPWKAVPLVPS